jgi:DNA-binding transcriptional MerR regulator
VTTTTTPLLPEQEYFKIGEACRIAQLPAYTLRYWETRFRQLRPLRRDGGHRRYSRGDMETLLRIKNLVWNRRMTLAGARKALARGPAATGEGTPARPALARLLKEAREDLRKVLEEFKEVS